MKISKMPFMDYVGNGWVQPFWCTKNMGLLKHDTIKMGLRLKY